MKTENVIKGAEFSNDKKNRFVLWRIWDDTKPVAMCIGLNPSNANEEKDDPTIIRTCKVLKALGFGGLKMVNIFTYITPNPEDIKSHKPDESWILSAADECQEIIFAWGSFKQIPLYFVLHLMHLFPDAKCFGKTKNGKPWHPSPLNRQMTEAYKNNKQLERYSIDSGEAPRKEDRLSMVQH
jgi:hypothetical protein